MKLRHLIHPFLMIAVLAVAFSLYGAWYARIGKESATAVTLASSIQQAKQNGLRAEEAKKELARAASDEAAIKGYFVDTADVVSFLESLQSTGTKLGTNVQVVSVSSQPASPHAKLQLALSITGTFDSVERTIGVIEYEPYDTTIQTLSLDTSSSGAGVPQWTANVTVSVGTIDSGAQATATKTSSVSASTTQP